MTLGGWWGGGELRRVAFGGAVGGGVRGAGIVHPWVLRGLLPACCLSGRTRFFSSLFSVQSFVRHRSRPLSLSPLLVPTAPVIFFRGAVSVCVHQLPPLSFPRSFTSAGRDGVCPSCAASNVRGRRPPSRQGWLFMRSSSLFTSVTLLFVLLPVTVVRSTPTPLSYCFSVLCRPWVSDCLLAACTARGPFPPWKAGGSSCPARCSGCLRQSP